MYRASTTPRARGRPVGIDDMTVIPEREDQDRPASADREVKEIQDQYSEPVSSPTANATTRSSTSGRAPTTRSPNDDGASAPRKTDRPAGEGRQKSFNSIFMMADSGRPRFAGADPPARRHARPDGEARRLDHRDADHGELPRRPERAAVLHLDPRRPQRVRGHRAEDRELRLPDPPSGRRGARTRGHRGRLRHPTA